MHVVGQEKEEFFPKILCDDDGPELKRENIRLKKKPWKF